MQKTITRLKTHLLEVPVRIALMNEEALHYKRLPHKWSKKEILGHLIDSAINNLPRFTNIPQAESPYQVQPYKQAELVIANDYQHQPLVHLLQFWSSLNRQIASVMEKIPETKFGKKVVTPEGNKVSFRWLMEDYVEHMEYHLAQIYGENESVQTSNLNRYAISVDEAMQQLSDMASPFVKVLEHGSMEIELYVPDKVDLQQPHTRDELYVVVSGSGMFVNGEKRHSFQAGDVLFVPAGVVHRFVEFTPDFKTWVIFYGPEGGE